ncbi:TlpA family protein disulfide reductase [Actinomyces vulturis]|uniref:TlpA family protein disulfide reductase n=1 Tax=Actinomyces vulturis TaxID=1857645 RepID=UPI00082A66CB|nr:MauE/DoxX family redox-associated membrane protein [Actinomyces vulturis]
MPQLFFTAPIIVGFVLGYGAWSKLRDDDALTAAQWVQMGLPGWLNRCYFRQAHPWVEWFVAVFLISGTACGCFPDLLNVIVAGVALFLCIAYLMVIVRLWNAPEKKSCACFGGDHETAVTVGVLGRNVALVILAVMALLRSMGIEVDDPDLQNASWTGIFWSLSLLIAMGMVVLVLQAGSRHLSTDGDAEVYSDDRIVDGNGFDLAMPEGSVPAVAAGEGREVEDAEDELDYLRTLTPHAPLLTRDDTELNLAHISRHKAHLLLFLSPGCGPCAAVAPHVKEWRESLTQIEVRVVVNMTAEELERVMPEWMDFSYFDPQGLASRMLTCVATPSAVLVGTDGMLAGGPVMGADNVIEFVEDVQAQLTDTLGGEQETPGDSSGEISLADGQDPLHEAQR